MSDSKLDRASKFAEWWRTLSADERARINERQRKTAAEEHEQFLAALKSGDCYVCGNPLASFSKKTPCLHWLLKPKGFKKHDMLEVAKRFGCMQIQTYLRWVANTQAFAKHINDLREEGTAGKLLEVTIRYKNLEWGFSCADSDFTGHATTQHAKHPHYHFQMRIDKRPFINFSDFHLPLTEEDVMALEAVRQSPPNARPVYPFGEGMAELFHPDLLEELVTGTAPLADEQDAPIKLDSIVMADEGTTIRGEDFFKLVQEAKEKGVSVASLLHRLPNTKTQVIVTPGPGVVEQAPRSGRKKKT